MRLSTLLSLTSVLLTAFVNAECCPCPGNKCADCTNCDAVSCCAYGKCNIFCCNCDDGCRRSSNAGLLRGSLHLEMRSTDDFPVCMPTIMAADANEDGKVSFLEWVDAMVVDSQGKATFSQLRDRWLRFDMENKGYLTYQEAMNRKAEAQSN